MLVAPYLRASVVQKDLRTYSRTIEGRRTCLLVIALAAILVVLPASWSTPAESAENPTGAQQATTPSGLPVPEDLAPAFDLKNLQGTRIRLADFKDRRIVVLNFWATWCPPCMKELPILQAVAEKYRKQPVTFLTVSIDRGGPRVVEKAVRRRKIELPVLLDTDQKVFDRYARAVPATYVIDQRGVLRKEVIGFDKHLENILSQVLDGILRETALKRATREGRAEMSDNRLKRAIALVVAFGALVMAPAPYGAQADEDESAGAQSGLAIGERFRRMALPEVMTDRQVCWICTWKNKKPMVISFGSVASEEWPLALKTLQVEWEKRGGHEGNIGIVAVCLDADLAPAKAFITENKLTFPVQYDKDKKFAESVKITTTPVTFFLDPLWTVKDKIVGFKAEDAPRISPKIDALLPAPGD